MKKLIVLCCLTLLYSVVGLAHHNIFEVAAAATASPSINYRSYIDGVGFEGDFSSDGATSGTSNKAIKAIEVKLSNALANTNVHYSTYTTAKGWSSTAKNGATSGNTDGDAIEAIRINLDSVANYVIEYRVRTLGSSEWLPWVNRNEVAGTTGISKPIDAVEIKLVEQNEEMRAAWVATVNNINFPKTNGADAQKKEIDAIFRELVDSNMNTVVFQINPTADAFYKSDIRPWSKFLTGTQGKDPGYDPLAYMLEKAEENNIEFHAWFNPYRITMSGQSTDVNDLAEGHLAREHPEWVVQHGSQLYFNPGIPEVQKYVINGILEVIENYDVDAIHIDDYFYPYPIDGKDFEDHHTFAEYGAGFDNIDDWRRDNVTQLVKNINKAIKAKDSTIQFGVSPFGIWRNQGSDPNGSATSGSESYKSVYADSRLWVKNEYVDYITPQIYWSTKLAIANYTVLVNWWAEQVKGTNVSLYIGLADYKVADNSDPQWNVPEEIPNQITLNRSIPQIRGQMHYNYHSFKEDSIGEKALTLKLYETKASAPMFPSANKNQNSDVVSYSVTYDLNGREGKVPEAFTTEGVVDIKQLETINDPDFLGWSQTVDGEVITNNFEITSNITLYAQWKDNGNTEFTVSYDLNGRKGEVPASFTTGGVVDVTKLEIIDDSDFLGWSQTAKGEVITNNFEITSNITLYAQWKDNDNTEFTVSYNLNGREGDVPASFTTSGIVDVTKLETIDDSDFLGWSQTAKGEVITNNFEITSNITLYAQWKDNDNTEFTVSYDLNGREGEVPASFTTSGVVDVTKLVMITGADFLGWSQTVDGEIITNNFEITSDITLYAQWKDIITASKYTLTFELHGGKGNFPDVVVNSGDKYTLPTEVPTKEGYKFLGWFTKESGGDKLPSSFAVNGNTSLHAQWESLTDSPKTGDNGFNSNVMIAMLLVGGATILTLALRKKVKNN